MVKTGKVSEMSGYIYEENNTKEKL